ncbi:MAG TPA: HEAT repeat domain-containing protein [Phycisphaerales bacterium]|nr:HEAT repeat domain-containing protein [Phycisphaerales bacterium]
MVLSIFCTFILAGNPETAFELLRIPEGFSKQLVASEPQVMDPVAFCFDDEGNILIAESFRQEQGVEDNRSSAFWLDQDLSLQTIEDRLEMYEHFADQRIHGMEYYTQYEDRIRLLKDVDGDGVYETANIFADGFNAPLDGTGAGVLALGDVVYYTCIPDLWAMQNGEKKSLHSGYGVRTALRGHDMHGLALGLDGRLYWSIGDRGYHIELDDGTVLHSPGEGAVFRSEFDGSGLEVYHHGLRNPQELAFDKYGNLFTGDNNSDSVDKARLVYCVEGGETGWRMEYQTLRGENERGPWVQENGWDPHAENRPAWILPAIDVIGSGPSGFVAYPGAGFSERYDDHFFMCDFRGGAEYSNVLSFAVEPDGAYFKMVDLHPFVESVLCTDVDFGYDGKMVISDWGEGWMGNFEGRLYSVWDEAHVQEGDVSEIFRKGFQSRTNEELLSMLSHVDRRVRIRAQYELVSRNAQKELSEALNKGNQLKKIHAMWALAMMSRKGHSVGQLITPLLSDDDPEIRAQACKIIGEMKFTHAFDDIVSLINDKHARVSYFATIAAGHLGNAHDEIVSMLARNNNEDVYLRHAGVIALTNSQYPSAMVNLQTHANSAVRLAAVLVLRRMESELVASFLYDDNLAIATEAARAIHDVPIDVALKSLASSLSLAEGKPWQRRAISACKRLSMNEKEVALFAADRTHEDEIRKVAIDALRTWSEPFPRREIVEGRIVHKVHPQSALDIDSEVRLLVANTEEHLLADALSLAQSLHVVLPEALTRTLLEDDLQPIQLRMYCLQVLSDERAVAYGLKNTLWQLRAVSRDLLLEIDRNRAVALLLDTIDSGEMGEAQEAIISLAKDADGFAKINKEALPVELQLEFAHASGEPLTFGDPQKGWWLHRGGDAKAGEKVVFENPRSQCIRCHIINNKGGIAGPSLDGVADRLTEQQLLEALLVPNLHLTEGYGEYSAMPPMGTLLDHRDLRDVMAYLKELHLDEK